LPDHLQSAIQALDFSGTRRHLKGISKAETNEPLSSNCNLLQMQTTACRLFRYIGIQHVGHATRSRGRAARRIKMKKIIPVIAVAALGVGFATAAQAHVSVGIGIGVPVAPAYPVYAAPPPPAYYAPPPPVVYAPPPPPPVVVAPPVVVGGYYGYGHPYYHHHGYWGRPYYRY
jgi:hypothetical protein